MGDIVRGSVVWLNIYPKTENKKAGYCPVLVLSDGLIDATISELAFVVPITRKAKGYVFEVPVPDGIKIDGSKIGNSISKLEGVALTDQAKSLDLAARNASIIGYVDPDSDFYKQVVTYVRSILA